MSFISIRILDIFDIIILAYILYQFYMLIRGTVAIKIFIGIAFVYLLWQLVKAINMQLLSTILGQFIGVGVIALIIVFQQELRNFLLLIGTRYFSNNGFSLEHFLSFFIKKDAPAINIEAIVIACKNMARTKTGALIVITRDTDLLSYSQTGETINSETSNRLLETIFFKNTPLHDGAVIITKKRIHSARCVLPVSDNKSLPKHLGLRHRSALGVSEVTDAFVIVVSEETGNIACAEGGIIKTNVSTDELKTMLEERFVVKVEKKSEKKIDKQKTELAVSSSI